MAKRCLQSGSDFQCSLLLFWGVLLITGCSRSVPPPEESVADRAPARGEKSGLKIRLIADEGKEKKFDAPDTAIRKAEGGYPKKAVANEFVSRNGEIFTDWKKPQLAIVLSGMLDGYIEPCGCAGLDNQKGGLSRRHTLFEELREKGWPVIGLDLGGMVRRLGPQAAIKYQRAIDAHRLLGYNTIGLGGRDLQLPTEILLAQLTQDEPSPFVSANVRSIFDDDFGLTTRFRVIEAGGLRIGVTQVLGEDFGGDLQNADFQYQTPADALPTVVKQLKAEKCDLLILLANASLEEARTLAKEFSAFNFVVVAGDSDPPPPQLEVVRGTPTRLIELGHKGMYLGVLGIDNNPQQHFLYQRVPLDGRFPNSKSIDAMLAAYQDQLQQQGLAGLGLRANPHPSGRQFVGSQACAECHTDEYEIWEETPHAHATETLTHLPIPRQFDPECLSCHVTGWEPQEYYPFTHGYESLTKTPHLVGNGCENCHGGGAEHVAAENGDLDVDDAKLAELRTGMRLTLEQARINVCVRCHDLDNSPDFEFDKYWPHVEH